MDYTGDYGGTDHAVRLAAAAREQAYAPFHGPAEGALFVTDDGEGVVGSRIENSNFTNTIHAVETALGDVLAADGDPEYLVVSTENSGDGSFLASRPQQLYEFVDGDFPVIVHEDGAVEQYTVDDIIQQAGRDGLTGGRAPDDLPQFTVDQPYTLLDVENPVDRIDRWRDAAYDAFVDRMDIEYTQGDPVDDVIQAAQDAFMTVDERPEDMLAAIHGYADVVQDDAHEPYSGYPVGVVLLDRDGRMFPGQNMEDADISNTLHGEGNAFTTAVTWGLERGDPVLLDVHTEGEEPPFPCGLCRQTAAEFADPETVLGAIGADGSDVEAYSTLGRHLPDMFRLDTGETTDAVRVALDVEGVLADIHNPFLDEYNTMYGTDFGLEDITKWGFGRVRDHFADETGHDDISDFLEGVDGTFNGFLPITAAYWDDYTDPAAPDRIRPVEENVGQYVQELHAELDAAEHDVQLDIVTAREDCQEEMQAWLRDHGISEGDAYDSFVISDDKHELPYTVYIDDNPYLAAALDGEQHQDDLMIVFDRPYNRDVDTDNHVRAASIQDVTRHL